MFVVLVGMGILTGYSIGIGAARAENVSAQVRTLNARVEVIQWDFDKLQAQLIAKELVVDPHK